MMTVANRIDVRKLSLSAQKALHQRVIEAYKKGIKRTQIAKTFGMSRRWVWKVLRAFEKQRRKATIDQDIAVAQARNQRQDATPLPTRGSEVDGVDY